MPYNKNIKIYRAGAKIIIFAITVFISAAGMACSDDQAVSTQTAAGYEDALKSPAGAPAAGGFAIASVQPDGIFAPMSAAASKIEFTFNNPNNAVITGKIFDMRGAHVADMAPGTAAGSLAWDGRDSGGSLVNGGVYIYQIEASGTEAEVINGALVVAR